VRWLVLIFLVSCAPEGELKPVPIKMPALPDKPRSSDEAYEALKRENERLQDALLNSCWDYED
jgi:hypothetical protein